MWEMHPNGAEVVICTAGSMALIQEMSNGSTPSIQLDPGQYAVNGAGTWHTADVGENAKAIFITAGPGTEHRAREASVRESLVGRCNES